MMRGVSRESFDELEGAVDQQAGVDALQLGDELFAVAHLLRGDASLRRALTDPSVEGRQRGEMARALLSGKVGEPSVAVVTTAASSRWSSTGDFAAATEHAAVLAVVISAEQAGTLDDLEDELFRFGRVVAGAPQLRDTVTNHQVPVAYRQRLVGDLLDGKASRQARQLCVQAVASGERSYETALETYAKVAADRQRRLVAEIRSAVALSEAERERLRTALARQYDRDIHLNVVVDPAVLGGIRVELGDDVIDGTVAGRLDDARRRMAG